MNSKWLCKETVTFAGACLISNVFNLAGMLEMQIEFNSKTLNNNNFKVT